METPLTGRTTVHPENIERELVRVRNALGASVAGDGQVSPAEQQARVRVTLSNLILLSFRDSSHSQEQVVDRLVGDLCMRHPSRFISVTFDLTSSNTDNLSTAVSSRCGVARSGAHVCSEEVYVLVAGEKARTVANLVRSLLLTDTQTVLIVLGDPRSVLLNEGNGNSKRQLHYKSLLAALQGLSDRVIYDSAQFSAYGESVKALLDFRRYMGRGSDDGSALDPSESSRIYQLRDSSWRRVVRWRRVISEQFDAEENDEAVSKINQIVLECEVLDIAATNIKPPSDALLFAGWFVGILGWKIVGREREADGSKFTIRYRNQKDQSTSVEFLLRQGTPDDTSGSISGATVYYQREGDRVVLHAKRDGEQRNVEVTKHLLPSNKEKQGKGIYQRRLPFIEKPLEDLIHDDIVSIHFDGSAEGALSEALKLADAL